MSFAFIQLVTHQNGATGLSTVISPSLTLTAGNTAVVGLVGLNGGSVAATSVMDSIGNNYTLVNTRHNASLYGGSNTDLWYCENVIGGTGTVTATFSYAASFAIINVAEYSGLVSSGSLDANAVGGAGSGTTSIPITTINSDDLIIGQIFINSGGMSTSTLTDRTGGFEGGFGIFGDQEQTPAGSSTITADGSGAWAGVLGAFKISGAAPATSKSFVIIMG